MVASFQGEANIYLRKDELKSSANDLDRTAVPSFRSLGWRISDPIPLEGLIEHIASCSVIVIWFRVTLVDLLTCGISIFVSFMFACFEKYIYKYFSFFGVCICSFFCCRRELVHYGMFVFVLKILQIWTSFLGRCFGHLFVRLAWFGIQFYIFEFVRSLRYVYFWIFAMPHLCLILHVCEVLYVVEYFCECRYSNMVYH